jgi:hypothetical protein
MMKRVFWFLLWWWRRLDTWQKMWLVASFLFGAGLAETGPLRNYLLAVLPVFVILSMIKWACWDSVRNAWAEFNKEQQHIIDQLKGHK